MRTVPLSHRLGARAVLRATLRAGAVATTQTAVSTLTPVSARSRPVTVIASLKPHVTSGIDDLVLPVAADGG